MGPVEPLVIGVVGASAPARRALAQALAARIAAETGWHVPVGQDPPDTGDEAAGVLICDELPEQSLRGTDFLLLVTTLDEPVSGGTPWRERLLATGCAWTGLDAGEPDAVERALDAVAPLLRRRAPPRDGLFTRLAQRNAAQAAWRWTCQDCDVPECEHALRRAPVASGAASR